MSTPTPVFVVPEIERYDCLSTSTPVSIIPVKREDRLFGHS